MKPRVYPDATRTASRRVLDHYESQSEDDAIVEDEAAYESTTDAMMSVPVGLVTNVRELIARRAKKA